MKLVSVHTRTVVDLAEVALPPYAILSHTRDTADQKPSSHSNPAVGPGPDAPPHHSPAPASPPPSNTKSRPNNNSSSNTKTNKKNQKTTPLPNDRHEQACENARRRGIEYIWIDELCIDRTSTADLDDAVNGSRRRLRNSAVCFAYLHDLPPEVTTLDGDYSSAWGRCRYWKRAWTLQELLLAPCVQFYDGSWNYRGDKDSPELAALLASITSIPRSVLLDSTILSDVALAVRISWSAGRVAAREEDTAYALVAITEATLPVRYGEGAERAFIRLQEELLRDTRDGSLLAWRSARDGEVRGLLARSPSEFGHFAPAAIKELQRPWVFNGKVRFSSKGIELESRVCKGPGCVLLSIGQKRKDLGTSNNIAICFREWNGVYVRVTPASPVSSSALRSWRSIDVMRDLDDSHSLSLRSLFDSIPCRIKIAKRGGYDEAWKQGMMVPRVVQDGEEVTQKQENHDAEINLDSDEVTLPLTPQESHTPSDYSDGSYIHVAMAGSWMGAPDKRHTTQAQDHTLDCAQQRTHDHDMYSELGADDDAIFSADSDPGSMTSNSVSVSASASVSESEWEDDDHNAYVDDAYVDDAYDDDTYDDYLPATETRSTTTLAADKDDRNSLMIMQPEIREQILATAYKRVCHWIPNAEYIQPPSGYRGSRINETEWFLRPETATLLNGTDSREHMCLNFRPHGFYHLACPFFAADPELHRTCVLEGGDLPDMAAVFRHLADHHPFRIFCAFCHCFFDTLEGRDAHMIERKCQSVGHHFPKGNAYRNGVHKSLLHKLREEEKSHNDINEGRRWLRVYGALFPKLLHDGDDPYLGINPYLRSGNGLAMSKAYDFWTQNKKDCVSPTLQAYGYDIDEFDEEALESLYKSTLKALINKIYHEYHVVKT